MSERPAATALRVGFVGFRAARPGAGQPTPSEALAGHLAADGVEVVGLVSTRQRRPARLADQAAAPLRWRRRADVVVIDVFSGPSFVTAEAATAAARLAGLPTVLVLHGGNLPAFAAAHPRRVERVLRAATAVVAPSRFLAAMVLDRGLPVTEIPNTVELGDVPWRDRVPLRPHLLWLRSFAPLYRPELAVEVLAALSDAAPDVTLTMAGTDKGSLAATRARAEELGVAARVTFPGFLDEAGRATALEEHDVLLNTNDVDNMPVSLLEAMACGLVVVTTDAGGIPAMTADGGDALVRPCGDVAALAEAVRSVLANPTLARRLAEGGRRRTESLRWDAVGTSWHEVLGRAAARGR